MIIANVIANETCSKGVASYDKKNMLHIIGWIFDKTLNDEKTALKMYELQIKVFPKASSTKLSIYNVAHMLRFQDRERSIKMFESISDTDIDAVYCLGSAYRYSDSEKAVEWFEKAIEREDVASMNALANMYYYGSKDYEKALQYYMMAADKGHIASILSLANFYRHGYAGLPQSEYKEFEWIMKVPYDQLPHVSKFNLGWYYIFRHRNQLATQSKGLKIMRDLVEQINDKDAMYMIGECYAKGYGGLDINDVIAKEWYKKSADNNDYDACVKLMAILTDEDERYNYFCKALKILTDKNFTFKEDHSNTKSLSIDLSLLKRLYNELSDVTKKLEDYEMRPPLIGGRLFREARERFNLSIEP